MKVTGGMITALITPFDDKGEVDFGSLARLVKKQVEQGVEGFVVSGTTAESPNLSVSEVEAIFKTVKENSPEGFQLILGAGTNSTKGTVEKIKGFEHLEPSGYLIVVPYYNKPSQAGMCAHFKAVAAATSKDIVLYDIPGRSVVEMDMSTITELSKVQNIVGIKDATGNISKLKELKASGNISDDFIFMSGDDGSTCEFIKEGGNGVISVLSHVVPVEFKKCMKGEDDFAKYANLCDLLFTEPNPTPAKYALKQMGVIDGDDLRLPLLRVSEGLALKLDTELKSLGVL